MQKRTVDKNFDARRQWIELGRWNSKCQCLFPNDLFLNLVFFIWKWQLWNLRFQFFHPIHLMDNLGTWVSLPTPCVWCVDRVELTSSVQDTSQGFLFDPRTLEPNMDGIAFSEAVRHMKKLWQAKGDLLQTANGWCLNRDDCHITHDWQPIWNFISNKPGNFCRVAGVRLLSKELASFPGKT